jgi:hypothetical protein
MTRVLGEVRFPFPGQSKSVQAKGRATLEGQVLPRGQGRVVLGQEGWLPGHTWMEGAEGKIPVSLSLRSGPPSQGHTASLPLGEGLMTKYEGF